jgi:hypothetical protein
MPVSPIAARVNGYDEERPISATPRPDVIMLAGISHGIDQRSVSRPKRGWTTDESNVAARTKPETAR